MVVRRNGKMKKAKVLTAEQKKEAEEKKVKGYLVAAFRRVWRWSAHRRACLKDAECVECGVKSDLKADHIDPVVPLEGLGVVNEHIDFNQLYERMFRGKLQALCDRCHTLKSTAEAKERKKLRDAKKGPTK